MPTSGAMCNRSSLVGGWLVPFISGVWSSGGGDELGHGWIWGVSSLLGTIMIGLWRTMWMEDDQPLIQERRRYE